MATVKAISNTQEQAKPATKPVARGDLWLAEISNVNWMGKAPLGSTAQDLDGNLAAWAPFGQDAKQFDRVTLASVDRSWVAEFIILYVGMGQCFARLVNHFEVPALGTAGTPKPLPPGWDIVPAQLGEGDGWVQLRLKDPNPLSGNGPQRFTNGGVPFRTFQDAYDDLLKKAIFATSQPTRYTP